MVAIGDYQRSATSGNGFIHVTIMVSTASTAFSMECGEQFYDSYQENYCHDMTREVAQSAPVREPPYRPRLRHLKTHIRAYCRSRPRAPDRQWSQPIQANAPPRAS